MLLRGENLTPCQDVGCPVAPAEVEGDHGATRMKQQGDTREREGREALWWLEQRRNGNDITTRILILFVDIGVLCLCEPDSAQPFCCVHILHVLALPCTIVMVYSDAKSRSCRQV
jgi:hypothetical protein